MSEEVSAVQSTHVVRVLSHEWVHLDTVAHNAMPLVIM